MTETVHEPAVAVTPWHLWVIAGLGVLWNGFASFDFAMTMLREPAYVQQIPADMIQFIDAAPAWGIAGWGLGVGAGLAGSLLLALRDWAAPWAFLASLAGLALLTGWQFSVGLPPSMSGPGSLVLIGVIWIIAVGLLAYARHARKIGILG